MNVAVRNEVEGRISEYLCPVVSLIQSEFCRAKIYDKFGVSVAAILQAETAEHSVWHRQRARLFHSTAAVGDAGVGEEFGSSLRLRFVDEQDCCAFRDVSLLSVALSDVAPSPPPRHSMPTSTHPMSRVNSVQETKRDDFIQQTDLMLRHGSVPSSLNPYNLPLHAHNLRLNYLPGASYPSHTDVYKDTLLEHTISTAKPIASVSIIDSSEGIPTFSTHQEAGVTAPRYYVILDLDGNPEASQLLASLRGLYPPEACFLLSLSTETQPSTTSIAPWLTYNASRRDVDKFRQAFTFNNAPPTGDTSTVGDTLAVDGTLGSTLTLGDTRMTGDTLVTPMPSNSSETVESSRRLAAAARCFPFLQRRPLLPILTRETREQVRSFINRVLIGLIAPTLERRMRALETQAKQQRRGLRSQFKSYLGIWQRPSQLGRSVADIDIGDDSETTQSKQTLGQIGEVHKSLAEILVWMRAYDKSAQSYKAAYVEYRHAKLTDETAVCLIGSGLSLLCGACQGSDSMDAKEAISELSQAMGGTLSKSINIASRLLYIQTATKISVMEIVKTPLTLLTLNECIRMMQSCMDRYYEVLDWVRPDLEGPIGQRAWHLQRAYLMHQMSIAQRFLCGLQACKAEIVTRILRDPEPSAAETAPHSTARRIQQELQTFVLHCFPSEDPQCAGVGLPSIHQFVSRITDEASHYFEGYRLLHQLLFETAREYHLGGNSQWASDCYMTVMLAAMSLGVVPGSMRAYLQWAHLSIVCVLNAEILDPQMKSVLVAFLASQIPQFNSLPLELFNFTEDLRVDLMLPFILSTRSVKRLQPKHFRHSGSSHSISTNERDSWLVKLKKHLKSCGVSLEALSPTYLRQAHAPLTCQAVESLVTRCCKVKSKVAELDSESTAMTYNNDFVISSPGSMASLSVVFYNPFRHQSLQCRDLRFQFKRQDVDEEQEIKSLQKRDRIFQTESESFEVQAKQLRPLTVSFPIPLEGRWILEKMSVVVCNHLCCEHLFVNHGTPHSIPLLSSIVRSLDGLQHKPINVNEAPLVLEVPKSPSIALEIYVRGLLVSPGVWPILFQYELLECRVVVSKMPQDNLSNLKVILACNDKILLRDFKISKLRRFEKRLFKEGTSDVTVDLYGVEAGTGGLRIIAVNDLAQDYRHFCYDLEITLVKAVSIKLLRINAELYHASITNKVAESALIVRQFTRDHECSQWVADSSRSNVVLYPEEVWKSLCTTVPSISCATPSTETRELNDFCDCLAVKQNPDFAWIATIAEKKSKLILLPGQS
eukprot:Gregarina_sp_Poly_1__5604@NODE_295_length_9857_cov_104_674974_g255_i0_p1_GENE_NODE_295_length_9857_cov_104_674974_g255_i0NODE_295_length_9857_cov_104_674974_g255_i0_p1_ORF_typecomplete_len1277_score180_95TRAPPCTrs85/PF12739_7/2_3e17DUF1319/PF07028_11/2_4DUF1319/PF07028_11/3_8e02_NODE_295_length_9857_cov_104_674974_g255_i022226052